MPATYAEEIEAEGEVPDDGDGAGGLEGFRAGLQGRDGLRVSGMETALLYGEKWKG